MCERMKHRGPDSEGLWLENEVALGMRRLSIIDLHTGEQPVYSEDKSVVVVMNGELYNFKDVRRDLEKRGHKFETKSDTEILPHLYEEHGEAMLEHLNGMFAFALWDKRRKKLLIARDRFGEKPLYYGVFDGKLIFASELKVFWQIRRLKLKSILTLCAVFFHSIIFPRRFQFTKIFTNFPPRIFFRSKTAK